MNNKTSNESNNKIQKTSNNKIIDISNFTSEKEEIKDLHLLYPNLKKLKNDFKKLIDDMSDDDFMEMLSYISVCAEDNLGFEPLDDFIDYVGEDDDFDWALEEDLCDNNNDNDDNNNPNSKIFNLSNFNNDDLPF